MVSLLILFWINSDANAFALQRYAQAHREHGRGTFYGEPDIAQEKETAEHANTPRSRPLNDNDPNCYWQAARKRHESRTRGRAGTRTTPTIPLP